MFVVTFFLRQSIKKGKAPTSAYIRLPALENRKKNINIVGILALYACSRAEYISGQGQFYVFYPFLKKFPDFVILDKKHKIAFRSRVFLSR